MIDTAAVRADFPSLASGIAHFDGPGGTQTPRVVAQAVADTLCGPLSNRGRSLASERNADDAVVAFRHAFADLLGAEPGGIVYGRSATQLTYDFSRHLAATWSPGDEVIVTRLDHDANVRPWVQAAGRAGATVRWLDIDPATCELDLSQLASVLSDRTRLLAVTGASNLVGTKPPLAPLTAAAHAAGALVHVDGVHLTAHAVVDIAALGVDFYVCSPYKFLGPHCAVLAAPPALLESINPDKLVPSTNAVPERFEFGTLPYEVMAGATAAVDYLADLARPPAETIAPTVPATRRDRLVAAFAALEEHEDRLRRVLEHGLADLGDGVTMHSRARSRTPTLLLTFARRHARDASAFLAGRAVLAPAGSFYAYEPFRRLGLRDENALRVGLAPYTDESDVRRLLEGIRDFVTGG